MPAEPDFPRLHLQTWILVRLYITMRFYVVKYRHIFGVVSPCTQKRTHVKMPLGNLIKDESVA